MKKLLWMAVLAVMVSGCGELSYKRGASTQDLEAAKAACQSAGSEKAAEQCLEANGWTVRKLDDIDLFATAGVSPDNRNPGAFTTPAFVPVTPARTAAVAPATTAAAPATEQAAAVSPLDLYTISSWWKIGADREALAADTNDCVTTLGEAHKPNAKTQQVTRGFAVCMHGKGWKALRAVAG